MRVHEALTALDVPLADLSGALSQVAQELANPQEFLTLTHGDWMAQSLWYGDAGPRFLDFRNGAYRHALLDLAAWEARCAANEPIADALWREYQEEWARLGAGRAERFLPALACARAFIALERLSKGEHSPVVQSLLLAAAEEPGLGALAGIVSKL